MKRNEPIRIGDLIRRTIEKAGVAETFDGQKICYLWPEVVGPTINRYTTRRWVTRDELHVAIASGPLKTEMAFMAEGIVKQLNELAGRTVITKMIIH